MYQVRKLVKRLTSDLETSIKQAAAQVQEIEVTGRVYLNLRAREAYCHKSCQQNLVVKAKRRLQAAPKEDSNTAKKKAGYEDAFSNVCGYSGDRIIGASEVERMTMLREWFSSYMQEKHPDFCNTKTEEETNKYVWYRDKVLDSIKQFCMLSSYNTQLLTEHLQYAVTFVVVVVVVVVCLFVFWSCFSVICFQFFPPTDQTT